MKRKLSSLILSLFALVMLMGAAVQQNADAIIPHVSAADVALQADDSQTSEDGVIAQSGMGLEDAEEFDPNAGDFQLLVDGEPADLTTRRTVIDNVSYVNLMAMAIEMDETAIVQQSPDTGDVTVITGSLSITCSPDAEYLVANGRYLYMPDGCVELEGDVMVPLAMVVEAFDATMNWDAETGTISVTRGSGAILSGDEFYNSDDLFWLSRVIYAESGNQLMEGRIGVGNVVMNRVNSPIFPNSILGVVAQRGQFSTYQNGKLANRTPNAGSVIAAKLVMDGAVSETVGSAFYFDTGNSWATGVKTTIAVLGGHTFYEL